MDKKPITILYVDDERQNLISFRAAFRIKYRILIAESATMALDILKENKVEIIITDQRMPQKTGVEFLERVLELYPDPVRILLTGYTDMSAVVDAVNRGKIFHYLTKPWSEDEVNAVMDKAVDFYNKKSELCKHGDKLGLSNEQLESMLRQQLIN